MQPEYGREITLKKALDDLAISESTLRAIVEAVTDFGTISLFS